MSVTGLDMIKEAARRCEGESPFTAKVPDGREQTHHGVTDFALAAWNQLRSRLRNRVIAVAGLPDYKVPDGDGNRTIEEPALVIITEQNRFSGNVYLTGCSWGYGDKGPHGTAAILHDLRMFPTLEDALRFASGVESMKTPWELERKR